MGSGNRAYTDTGSAFDPTTGTVLWSVPGRPLAALEGGKVSMVTFYPNSSTPNANILVGADGSTLSSNEPNFYDWNTGIGALRYQDDTQIGIGYASGYFNSFFSAVAVASASLDAQAGRPTPLGSPENRMSAEKCTDDASKEQLRQEYITLHTKKVPSCKSFVNGFPVPTFFYQFGHAREAGKWLVDSDYDWALLSPAFATAVDAIMRTYQENRPLRSGYRNPVSSNALSSAEHGDDPHSRGIGADFSIRDASGNISQAIWQVLHDIAKDQYTASQIYGYGGSIACVEPWVFMQQHGGANHFHVDVVTTVTCEATHAAGW